MFNARSLVIVIALICSVASLITSSSALASACNAKCDKAHAKCTSKAIMTYKESEADSRLSKEQIAEHHGGKLKKSMKRCHETSRKCTKGCRPVCDNCEDRYETCVENVIKNASWTTDYNLKQEQIEDGKLGCAEKRETCLACEAK